MDQLSDNKISNQLVQCKLRSRRRWIEEERSEQGDILYKWRPNRRRYILGSHNGYCAEDCLSEYGIVYAI